MLAREMMTTDVVTAKPDATRAQIARALIERGVSALPVVDSTGVPLGVVSEGDLIGREEPARKQRRDWWLAMLAEGEALSQEFVASLGAAGEATARDLMSTPVIAVEENTEAAEIARLLASYHIKRVPVLREGKIVGIVSRADLLRAIAAVPGHLPRPVEPPLPPSKVMPATAISTGPGNSAISADDFRHLVHEHLNLRVQQDAAAQQQQRNERKVKVRELICHHIVDDSWRSILLQAHKAAENGDKEFLMLRFPNEVCSDGGRAINAPESDWPTSLRGEAAEIYCRWKQELKPQGFGLAARVLDFPGGVPGDIGLFLTWGE
jgi:CBS domain-containing protein